MKRLTDERVREIRDLALQRGAEIDAILYFDDLASLTTELLAYRSGVAELEHSARLLTLSARTLRREDL